MHPVTVHLVYPVRAMMSPMLMIHVTLNLPQPLVLHQLRKFKTKVQANLEKGNTCPRPQPPPPRLVHQLMICKNPVRSVLFQVSHYNSGTSPQRHPFNTDTSLLWTIHLVHERLKSIYISVKRTPL